MADYKISIGAELRTKDIDTAVKNYKGEVNVKAKLDTDGISTALNGYKAKPIEIESRLNTQGITDGISNYSNKQNRKKIKVDIDPNFTGIGTALEGYSSGANAKKLKVGIDLDWTGIASEINSFSANEKVKVGIKLDDNAVSNAISELNSTINKTESKTKIKIGVDPDFDGVDAKIQNYTPRKLIKVNTKINKSQIDKSINEFRTNATLKISNVALTENAVKKALTLYNPDTPVPVKVNFELGSTNEVDAKIQSYKTTPVPISAKLVKSVKGFTTNITKDPVCIDAELKPDAINKAITNAPKNLKPISIDVKLVPKDINGQIKQLPVPTEPLNVKVELNEASVNNAITSSKHTALLDVGVKLDTDDINTQIGAVQPNAKIQVGVDLNNNDVNKDVKSQPPILANIKLDRDKINEQIRNFKTKTKIKVGVKLDFASHEGGQKGIPQQIKDYKTKSKIKVGVELNKESIAQEIANIGVDTPIKLNAELEPDDVQRINSQIEDIRQQLQNLGNITINLGGSNINNGSGSGGNIPNIAQQFREVDIQIGVTEDHVENLTRALRDVGFNDASINTITRGFEELGISVRNVTSRLRDDGSVTLTVNGIDQFERAVTTMSRVDENGITNLGTTISQNFRETENAFNRLKTLAKEMGQLEIKIAGLDSEQSRNEIAELTAQLNRLSEEYRDLFIITGRNLSGNQFDELVEISQKAADKVSQLNARMADMSNSRANAQVLREINQEMTDFVKIQNKISQKKIEIGKLEVAGGNSNQISELKRQLEELEATYESLMQTFMKKLTVNADIVQMDDVIKFDDEIAEATQRAENKLKELDAKVADTKAKLAENLSNSSFKALSGNQFNKVQSDFNKIVNVSNEVNVSFEALETSYNELANAQQIYKNVMSDSLSTDTQKIQAVENLINANDKYQDALKTTNNLIAANARDEKDAATQQKLTDDISAFQSKIDGWLTKNSAAVKQFGAEMLNLKMQAENCDRITLDHLKSEFKRLDGEAEAAGKKMQNLGDRIKTQFSKYSQYLSIASVFMYAEQGLRDMFNQVVAIDTAMTELKKVTDETDASYNKFLTNAASKSKELGTTIDGLVTSTADFARLGYGFEDSQKLAEVANVYAVVGDEIDGVEDATQSLVSTLAAFKGEIGSMSDSDFAMSIVDKMNEVSNNFAISSGGIGQALQRSASSMAAANNSLDETIAMITAANTVAQNPEKVGNAFKTMSMRIRGAKTELEEAGESTEGMAESTASLRQEMLALSGVDIMLNNNTFKSTYQIMDELSEKWENLSDIAQATIIELVAGKHQGNVFASLMANFDIAREALDTSLNSSGSAMKEHAKWSESLEARLNKLKATWQSLSQSFMSSDFLKIAIDGIITFIDVIDKLIQTIGTLPTLLGGFAIFKSVGSILSVSGVGGIKSLSDILATLSLAFPKAATGVKIFTSALAGSTGMTGLAKAATIGKGAISGLWAVIASHPILATVAAIGIGIVAFNKWNESAEELSERIEEVTTKYKDQHGSLMKMKGDFDTSNEESLISKYGELSKGVNALGENLSLTADEYAEYQNIVNTIADQFPSLVSGYNSQGDAILSCAGNVEELTNKYKELIKEQNSEVLKNGSDIFKDFKNDLKDTSAYYKELVQGENGSYHKVKFDTKHFDGLENLMNLGSDDLESAIEKLSNAEVNRISGLLDEYGIKRNVFFDGEAGFETQKEHIIKALSKNKAEIKKVLDEAKTDLNKYAEDLGTVTESYFSTAFLGGNDSDIGDYSHLSERMQNIINQVTSGFDSEFYADFLNKENPYEELTKYFDSMLGAFDNLDASGKKQFEASFDLKTKFNSGEISYGEYVNGIQNAENLINGLDGLDEDVKNQIKLALNTEEVAKDYDALKKRLTSDEYNIKMNSDEAEEFLNGLTSSEYSVAIDLMANGEIDFSKFNIDSFRKYIEEQAKLQEAMNFTIAMDIETESIEALNTAMAESVSGVGLSSEAITALRGRYAELESQGYNLSAMFEETANGIHLNKKAVGEFEQKLASDKLAETDKQLGVLKNRYDELTTEIDKCKDAGDRAALYTEQQSIVDKINDLATLASQYEGLTSAYNAWQNAESAGQERDMYENMLEGFETVKDEISRGWIDDGTTQFLKLLYGDKTTITKIVDGKKVKEEIDIATASASDLKQAYKELDNTIEHTTYSVKDFFTVDEDGNSTSKGVYNFLDAIGQMEEEKFGGKDVVKRDKNGKAIGFDFEVVAKKDENGNVIKNGDQVVAEALGISEELIQIMLRAADDAGFVVNLEGAYTQLADLKTEAESARDTLISLQKNGLEKLKGVDVNFDLNAEGNDLVAEQGKAVELLDKFKKDGKIDLKMEGAQQALDIAEYLTIRLDDLTEPKFMQIDTSEVEEDLRNPIEKIQEIGDLCKEKHLVTLTGDTKEIDEVQSKINKVAKEIEELDPKVKAQIGIDDNWDSKTIADKIEKGEIEIPAELELDVQMSDDLKDMRLMMMNQLGLASDEEVKLKVGFDIDESLVNTLDDKKQTVVLEYITKNEKEFNKLTEEEKEVVVKLIADGVDLENYEVEDKEAIVNYIANGEEADGWTPEAKDAFVKYLADGGEIDKFDPKNKESWVVYDTDTTKPDGYEPDDEDATVIFGKDTSDPDGYDPNDPKATVIFDKDTSAVDSWKPVVTGIAKFTLSMIIPQGVRNALAAVGISVANGTANVNGTAFSDGSATELSGKAFKHGSWGTKDSGTALMGEVGREIIVRDGKFFTVGDFGAGFYQYKKGDIIFNHKQTEELFKYGKVTSGGGRGKAFANGTAFSSGTGGGIAPEVKSHSVDSKKKSSTKSSSSSSSSSKDDFEETLDFVEIAISRIERAIDLLDKKANNIYKSWSSRNKALTSEINKVRNEIELQQSAYNRYIKEANSVGLSGSWAKKVRDGNIDISTVKDEKLAEKIKDYQTWFEKALACKDAIEELKETESSLYAQRLENVSAQYEGILGVIEHEKNMLEEYISQSEAQGHLVSANYYNALASNEKDNIAQLKKEKSAMLSELQTAMNSGTITKNSEAYYDMVASIDEVTLSITKSETALKEYAQTIQELDFEVFDILQNRISAVAEEAEFLIELMNSDKLFDDNGQLTNSGKATLGLHGQNYNTYMYQSDKYATEIADLDKEIVKDPYDQELIDRRQELLELQQEAILSAQQEKEAIRDLVSDGIDVQLDALQKLIDKKNETLESERDLYEYQKKVKEQTEEIATLEKQLSAYSGDDSEEARQKIQQIKVDLETARQNLEETETDRLIESTASLLDNLYLEAEELLNMRLDNLDALVLDVIAEINADSTVIGNTIRETADSVGYTLSDSMTSIWDTNSTKINDVITVYGEKFSGAQTTTNNALNTINTNLQNVITQLNSIAKTNVKSASNSSASNSKEANKKKEEPKKDTPKKDTSKSSTIKIGGKINANGAKIYDYAGDKSGERQLYRNDPIYKVLKTDGNWLQVRWHKLSKGVTGWFKKGDVKAYATGKKNFANNEVAWTQENGLEEYIVRPSDGAILTPIARKGSVLNAQASNNIWDMANSPAEFIKDNLNLGSTNVPNNSNIQSSCVQNFDKVIFNMPNVKNYGELLSEMQRDPKFEKLILAMTLDQVAGKSKLAKGKAIR